MNTQPFPEPKKCPECNGEKGYWITYSQPCHPGGQGRNWHFCRICKGTGLPPEPVSEKTLLPDYERIYKIARRVPFGGGSAWSHDIALEAVVKEAASHARKEALRELVPKLVALYTIGYQNGHHDTVESQYTDVAHADVTLYFADVVAELAQELDITSELAKGTE